MNISNRIFLFFSFLMTVQAVYGRDLDIKRNQAYIGPQWYHVKRTNELGTSQQGNMYGIRLGYDRLKRYGWYVGAEASYAKGTLKGRSGSGNPIKSRFTDMEAEGRLGYTFQQKYCLKAAFTPFLGIGYHTDFNNFIDPSPVTNHNKIYFAYGTAGFLSRIYVLEQLEIGLNFKTKFPIEPKCRVSHDDENSPGVQTISERFSYRVDLPITYRFDCSHIAIALAPFYEYRQFGGHPNFPFDFFKTKFCLWGVNLFFEYQW